MILYLTDANRRPLTEQCIRGLLKTKEIEYLANRIFCAEDNLFNSLSKDFKIRVMIFEGAADLLAKGKKRGETDSSLQAAQLLSAFYQRGADIESKRDRPLTAQTVLYDLQKHYPFEAVLFATDAVRAGCRLKDSVLAHTLIEGEKVICSLDGLQQLVSFARTTFRSGILLNSPYATTFQTLLSKISSPAPLERRLTESYCFNETLLAVGERLLLAHDLGLACIESGQRMNNQKNKLIINNLVRSLASYSVAVAVEQSKFTHPKQHQGYLTIAHKLGIEFKRNQESRENLCGVRVSELLQETLRASIELANACFSSTHFESDQREYFTLEYSLNSAVINQILFALTFTNFLPDETDCEVLERLLKASLVVPETREQLHSEYVSGAILAILYSPSIAPKTRTESALRLTEVALQMRRAPNDVSFFTKVRDEFLRHHPRERSPLIARNYELSHDRFGEYLELLQIVEGVIEHCTPSVRPTVFLKGGLG
jgi:hypothetical protein